MVKSNVTCLQEGYPNTTSRNLKKCIRLECITMIIKKIKRLSRMQQKSSRAHNYVRHIWQSSLFFEGHIPINCGNFITRLKIVDLQCQSRLYFSGARNLCGNAINRNSILDFHNKCVHLFVGYGYKYGSLDGDQIDDI